MRSWCVDDWLAPLGVERFRDEVWGRQCVLFRAGAARTSPLMTWDDLNRLLTYNRFEYPRLTFARDGRIVEGLDYLRLLPQDRWNSYLLDHEGTMAQFRSGATMVLDHIHELHEPIRQFADAWAAALGVDVRVNMYLAGLGQGFNVHWDDHDVLIVQVQGRKAWTVYEATTPNPVEHTPEVENRRPSSVVFQGILEPGDLLYIPRGFWHEARASQGPTLHLTHTLQRPMGRELARFALEHLIGSDACRQDIPLGDAGQSASVMAEVLADCATRLQEVPLDASLAQVGPGAPQTPFRLPAGLAEPAGAEALP